MNRFRKALTLFDDYYDMMSDQLRIDAYARAISAHVKPGDVVVDLGAGLGILSLLAARAGAEKVYAIEKSDAASLAQEIAKANDLDDRIEVVSENSKTFEIPERADVLVSETLGSFAIDENTLDFTLDVRERLLKPDAILIPRRLALWLAPTCNPQLRERAEFWSNVAGFDFSPAREQGLTKMSVVSVESSELLADPELYAAIDLRRHQRSTIEKKIRFAITRQGTIQGVVGWFQAELADDIVIDTSPMAPATHWKQASLPLPKPIDVVAGDYLELFLRIGPESDLSDNTTFNYEFRCTQFADE
jgi:hypothetical protein